MKSEIKNLWPTNIVINEYDKPQLNEDLKKIYLGYIERYEITQGSYRLTGKEEPQVLDIPYEQVIELKSMFLESFEQLVESYHPRLGVKFKLEENPRISVMQNGDHRQSHIHIGTEGFGIYYIDVGDVKDTGTGLLELNDPRHLSTICLTNNSVETIVPKPGMLIVAPSYLWHAVSTYKGTQPRIAIVVNFLIDDEKIEQDLYRKGRR